MTSGPAGFRGLSSLADDQGADRAAYLTGDDRTLDPEQEEDPLTQLTQRLVVALTLGDDQVASGQESADLLAAVTKECARGVGAVVDDPHHLGQPNSPSVFQGGIIQDGRSAHDDGCALSGQFFDEQPIEDDLTGIVGNEADRLGILHALGQLRHLVLLQRRL